MEILQEMVTDTIRSIQHAIETLESNIEVILDLTPSLPVLDISQPMDSDLYLEQLFDGVEEEFDFNSNYLGCENNPFQLPTPSEQELQQRMKRHEDLRKVYKSLEKSHSVLCNEYDFTVYPCLNRRLIPTLERNHLLLQTRNTSKLLLYILITFRDQVNLLKIDDLMEMCTTTSRRSNHTLYRYRSQYSDDVKTV